MKTAYPCLAGLCALALAVVAIPAPGNELPARDLDSPHAHTAIGAVLDANGGTVPATGLQLAAALAKLGDFVQLPVAFSAVAPNSGIANPRVVLTMRPSSHSVRDNRGVVGSQWGGSQRTTADPPSPLGAADPNRPYLEGRLFLAANTELDRRGSPVVRTVEFISWNSRQLKFDFGVIEGMGTGEGQPELKVLDGTRCFSCHKNRGPILGVAPWSNTAHRPGLRATPKAGPVPDDFDGMHLQKPQAAAVDAAVRHGAGALRDRESAKLLARTAEGRKALAMLLAAVVSAKPITDSRPTRAEMNRLDLVAFLRDAHAARKAAAPSELLDFNPVARPDHSDAVRPSRGEPWNPLPDYEKARARGQHGLPAGHQPSNPKAFARPAAKAPTLASEVVTPVTVARAVGLSEGDRRFLTGAIRSAADKLGAPALSPEAVAALVLAGPHFADVLATGVLPDRDDFKDRFVAGLSDLTGGRGKRNEIKFDRANYAATPARDPFGREEKEVVVLPSHACLACHDIRGAKPAAFNPIPALAFDPFDAAARAAWLKAADRAKKADVLGRLVKRLGTDRDMPPEDSAEAALYRAKNPAALDAVKDWLDAEWRRAKAN